MDILSTLIERRSVKKYKNIPVENEKLEKILKAGLYAANGRGLQSVKFLVVKNKELRDQLSKLNASIMNAPIDPFYGAPYVIVAFGDSLVSTYVEDASLAIGNMLNEAYSIGVDSCWIHRAKEMFETEEGKKIKEKYGIPSEYVGVGNLILGYRDYDLPAAKERKEGRIIIVE